jgi:hypothetical protein
MLVSGPHPDLEQARQLLIPPTQEHLLVHSARVTISTDTPVFGDFSKATPLRSSAFSRMQQSSS